MNELEILKLVAKRPDGPGISEMQIKDIVGLIELDFDMDYVEEWCGRLGLDLILRRVSNERHK